MILEQLGDDIHLGKYAPLVMLGFLSLLMITYVCVSNGVTSVFPHLYYLFIIPVAFFFQLRGVLISVFLSIGYLALSITFTPLSFMNNLDCVIRTLMLIAIAVFISYISKISSEAELLRLFFEASGTGRAIIDKDGLIVDANDHIKNFFGYKNDEVLKHHYNDFISPDDIDRVGAYHMCKIDEAADAPPDRYECKLLARNGRYIDCLCNAVKIPDTDNTLISIIDISRMKQMQDALAASEEKFREIFNNASDAIMLHGITADKRPGVFFEVNEAACRMLQYDTHELHNMSVGDINSKRQSDTDPVLMRELFEKQSIKFEGEMVRKDGTIFPVELNTHLFELGGETVVLSVARDITERKHGEELLKQSINDKDALIHEIHHRVKNNMAVITGFINMQMENVDDPGTKSVLKDLENRIWGLDAAQDSIYHYESFANISAQMHFYRVISSILMNSRNKTNISVDVDAGDLDIDVPVAMNTSLILTEIVLNSIKHAFEGREKGSICLKFCKTEKCYELVVSDDGIGLPEITDFSGLDTLGMKIIKRVVEMGMKGNYDIKSNNGTTWTIRFPYNSAKQMA